MSAICLRYVVCPACRTERLRPVSGPAARPPVVWPRHEPPSPAVDGGCRPIGAPMSALSDLLNETNAGRLSARSLARAARAAGFTLNHDTAARYLRGDHGRPDEETLRAFANVLPVQLSELRIAADLPAEETEPYQPPAEASRLSRRQRRAVDEIIRAMLEPQPSSGVTELGSRRKTERSDRESSASRRSPQQPKPRAARRGGAEPPTK